MIKTNTIIFIVFALCWEVMVGILYGLFFRYSPPSTFASMASTGFTYSWALGPNSSQTVAADTTQFQFTFVVVFLAIALLVVGLALIAGYIQRSSVMGISLTLLIFALTAQNFFVFRIFWQNVSVNDPNSGATFGNRIYDKINPINFGNTIRSGYPSAGLMDAVGAALAMYAAYTSVIGKIGLAEVFFLTWIGPFLYQLNSQLLWRLTCSDTGYPLRAFAFGGAMGVGSSITLGQTQFTDKNANYYSSYRIMGMALVGLMLVWCAFPILLLSSTYTTASGIIVSMAGQVNMWQALASSVLGVMAACSFYYRKLSIHQLIFTSLSGGIAFSAVTDINYNTGAATAIGFGVGFVCAMAQISLKRSVNKGGIVDANGTIFQFLLPSFFAAIFVAVGQGVGKSAASFTTSGLVTINYLDARHSGRGPVAQGGYQMLAWLLSVGIGTVAGLILGVIYRLVNGHYHRSYFFNDAILYNYPGPGRGCYVRNQPQAEEGKQKGEEEPIKTAPAILNFDNCQK